MYNYYSILIATTYSLLSHLCFCNRSDKKRNRYLTTACMVLFSPLCVCSSTATGVTEPFQPSSAFTLPTIFGIVAGLLVLILAVVVVVMVVCVVVMKWKINIKGTLYRVLWHTCMIRFLTLGHNYYYTCRTILRGIRYFLFCML